MFIAALLTADDTPSTAKVSPMLLPAEVYMERFVEPIGNKDLFQTKKARITGKKKKIKDVCNWAGVTCCESGAVKKVKWSRLSMGGSFDVQWFPLSVTVFECAFASLEGTWDFTGLPDILEVLNLQHNSLTGCAALTSLPTSMLALLLKGNKFEGSVDLLALPPALEVLDLYSNRFVGSVDLTRLPLSLRTLSLGSNMLTGSADCTQLPEQLYELTLRQNQLHGSFSIDSLPAGLRLCDISRNNFSGEIDAAAYIAIQSKCFVEIAMNTFTIVNRADTVGAEVLAQWQRPPEV